MNRSALWPVAIIGVLGVTVVANGVILYEANHGPTAIEPDYYRKAVDWDSTLAQADRNAALGWFATTSVDRAGGLRFRLVDRSGAAIDHATVSVAGFAIAGEGGFSLGLSPRGDGEYGGRVPLTAGGLHELRFEARRGSDRFTTAFRGIPGASFAPKP